MYDVILTARSSLNKVLIPLTVYSDVISAIIFFSKSLVQPAHNLSLRLLLCVNKGDHFDISIILFQELINALYCAVKTIMDFIKLQVTKCRFSY